MVTEMRTEEKGPATRLSGGSIVNKFANMAKNFRVPLRNCPVTKIKHKQLYRLIQFKATAVELTLPY